MSKDPKKPFSVVIRQRRPLAEAPAAMGEPERPRETDPASAETKAEQVKKSEADAVGYKRPPKHSQFQPGRSGNPQGRPKGAKNWSTIFNETASRQRDISVGGKKIRMSAREAVAEQMIIAAIKGDRAARRDFLNEVRAERERTAPDSEKKSAPESVSANDQALLADFLARAGKARSSGDAS